MEWAPSEELLAILNRDLAALDSSFARERIRGIEGVVENGRYDAVPRLVELLDDDAPHIWDGVIGEVRFAALAGLQRLHWITRDRLELGRPVLVRKAWPLRDMRRAYDAAMAELSPPERAAVLARASQFLEERVKPHETEADDMRAYRVLQELGKVDYERQELDPATNLTPLQASIYAEQAAPPRPRPCLRVSLLERPGQTIGFLYRNPINGIWARDFSEHPASVDARDLLAKISTLGTAGAIPRVVHDDAGQPRRNPDGSFVLDGEVSPDSTESDDVVDYLRSVAAFMQPEFATELLLPEGTDGPRAA
jgi:hypothetical protein